MEAEAKAKDEQTCETCAYSPADQIACLHKGVVGVIVGIRHRAADALLTCRWQPGAGSQVGGRGWHKAGGQLRNNCET